MKKEQFFELLGEMDKNAVKSAETAPVRKKKTKWLGYGLSAAACLVLIAGIGFWYHYSSVSTDDEDSMSDYETFQTKEQLYTYLQDEITRNPESVFAQNVRKEQVIPVYSLEVPQDYELEEIETAGYSNYITMHYRNTKDDTHKITFVWGYKTLGDKTLNQAIEMIGLTEIPGMDGYYYVGTMDDSGTSIYQIYWSEDGYYMQVNVPVDVFGQIGDGSAEISYMPLTLRKEKMMEVP